MRLIDADLLQEILAKEPMGNRTYLRANEIVVDMPIAYDVEKVIEKIEKLTNQAEKEMNEHFDNDSNYPCEYNLADLQEKRYNTFCEVLEIVKAGGVNEK